MILLLLGGENYFKKNYLNFLSFYYRTFFNGLPIISYASFKDKSLTVSFNNQKKSLKYFEVLINNGGFSWEPFDSSKDEIHEDVVVCGTNYIVYVYCGRALHKPSNTMYDVRRICEFIRNSSHST